MGSFDYLFDQVPGEAVIGRELQAHLGIDVRGRLTAATHHKRELEAVGGSDLHGLSLHVADAGARAGLTWETGAQGEEQPCGSRFLDRVLRLV